MGFRLKISFKTEHKLVVVGTLPIAGWCEACGARSWFVDQQRQLTAFSPLAEALSPIHTACIDGRRYICLRSITAEPEN